MSSATPPDSARSRAHPLDVLVVEDGFEYLNNLSTFVAEGIAYRQARSGHAAMTLVRERTPDLVYLDMRFDRTPVEELLGSIVELTARFNGDIARARRFQQDNQGLFVLRALREAGYTGPIVLSYDFGAEERRFKALSSRDPHLSYCPDYADARTIRATIEAAVRGVGDLDS
jgi:DNA-binding response OmpR family regulator